METENWRPVNGVKKLGGIKLDQRGGGWPVGGHLPRLQELGSRYSKVGQGAQKATVGEPLVVFLRHSFYQELIDSPQLVVIHLTKTDSCQVLVSQSWLNDFAKQVLVIHVANMASLRMIASI